MPPKAKLHKEKGKLKSFPKPVASSSQNVVSEPSVLDPEMQRQFEVELCWCIQQLQTALSSGKLNQKQTQDTTKTLNTLMSNSAPLIKKRQLMRLTFGDYRAKMALEEKKHKKINHHMNLVPVKPSKKSVFVKKAPFLASDSNFKFNFIPPTPEEKTLEENISELTLENKQPAKSAFHFEPSNNTFKFNFDVTKE